MSITVAQMSKHEFKQMLKMTVEQKLLELLGDPDEGLELRKSVRARLSRQKKAVAAGERGEPFEDVMRRLGLES
jgi:ABC-type hemin transport system substrate-binding protein